VYRDQLPYFWSLQLKPMSFPSLPRPRALLVRFDLPRPVESPTDADYERERPAASAPRRIEVR
jgi:hypothetical protein